MLPPLTGFQNNMGVTAVVHPRQDNAAESVSPRSRKRRKASPHLNHYDYTIAWICDLEIEMHAGRAMLDEIHENLPRHPNDKTNYTLGSIHGHNIVMACLPTNQHEPNNATITLMNLKRSFPLVRLGMMVGISGGVPSKTDLRLGDVVVGTRVMPADPQNIIRSQHMQTPFAFQTALGTLSMAVSALRVKHEEDPSSLRTIILQRFARDFAYWRPALPDNLLSPTNTHIDYLQPIHGASNQSSLIKRKTRASEAPYVHYGAIASVNQPVTTSTYRDELARGLDVICIGIETANLMTVFPCLPIRGVSDYSDSNQNREWQGYAAAAAAAYGRQLLAMPNVGGDRFDPVRIPESVRPPVSNFRKRRSNLMESIEFKNMNCAVEIITNPHRGTCNWILSHPTYVAWHDLRHLIRPGRLLWISGRAGSGKSTLMKFLYLENLYNTNAATLDGLSGARQYAVLCFFFRAHSGLYSANSILGMYRSLLLQLLQRFDDLQVVADDLGLDPTGHDCPPLDLLKVLFRKAILAYDNRVFRCFIDTPDGCDEQEMIDMIQDFEDLVEEASKRNIILRICFSSCYYTYINTRQGLMISLENEPGHLAGLRSYVEDKLQVKDAGLVQDIVFKAAGGFLWIVLVVNILNKEEEPSLCKLREELSRIPSGLTKLFNSILRRDDHPEDDLQLCLFLILCVKRPLRVLEFHHALWSGLSSPNNPAKLSDTSTTFNLAVFGMELSDLSKGLVSVTNGYDPTVQFIHESVHNHFLKENHIPELWPQLGPGWFMFGHDKVKNCCFRYIEQYHTEKDGDWEAWLPPGQYPFLKYSCKRILFHANSAAKVVDQSDLKLHSSVWLLVHALGKYISQPRFSADSGLIHILASQGCSELIRRAGIKTTNFADSVSNVHENPFFAAMMNGHKDSVAALLDIPTYIQDGEDITGDAGGYVFPLDDDNKESPLEWAAGKDNLRLLRLLLGKCNPDDRQTYGAAVHKALLAAAKNNRTDCFRLLANSRRDGERPEKIPLFTDVMPILTEASSCGYNDMVAYLLAGGANMNEATECGHLPLVEAARAGHLEIVQLLLLRGADHLLKDSNGHSPHSVAMENCRESVTRFLFEWNAKQDRSISGVGSWLLCLAVEAGHVYVLEALFELGVLMPYDEEARSLLLSAITHGQEGVIKVLLENGAQVGFRNEGHSVVLRAMALGHVGIVDLFLETGIEMDYSIDGHRSILSETITSGHVGMLKLLLDKGASMATNSQYDTPPIPLATRQEDPAIRRLLIEEGAHARCIYQSGWTALAIASKLGYEGVVKYLLHNGAKVEIPSKPGYSALYEASKYGYATIVKLLLEHGPDIKFLDDSCQNSLSIASEQGHVEVVEVLLDKGAATSRENEHTTRSSLQTSQEDPQYGYILPAPPSDRF